MARKTTAPTVTYTTNWDTIPDSDLGDAIHFIMPDAGNISREFILSLSDGRRVLNPVLVKEFDRPWSPPHRTTPQILNRWTKLAPLRDTQHEIIMLWGFVEMHLFAFEKTWSGFGVNDQNYRTIPGADGGNENRPRLLPRAMVKETLAKFVQPVFDVVDYLRTKGLNLSTLAGPPPVRDNQFITSQHPGFTPASPETRRTIYELLVDLYRAHADSSGYRFFEVPAALRDEQGFRREEHSGDGAHANALYGREILLFLEKSLFAP